jgi:hypothetical protein
MKIESIIRRKDGTKVEMGDMKYHFKPSENDPRHLEEVTNTIHIARFLSITEGYRVPVGEAVPELPAAPVAQDAGFLIGSDAFQPVYQIGGREVQLGELVREAFETSELTEDQWNKLQQEERDSYIQDELDLMKANAREKGDEADPDAPPAVNNPNPNPEPPAVLLGTEFEPAEIDIGNGQTAKTKDVAEAAFAASGLTIEAWNALGKEGVMEKMGEQLESMKTPPAPPAAPSVTAATAKGGAMTPQQKRAKTIADKKAKAAAEAK